MVGTLVSIHEKMGDADAVACFEGATETEPAACGRELFLSPQQVA